MTDNRSNPASEPEKNNNNEDLQVDSLIELERKSPQVPFMPFKKPKKENQNKEVQKTPLIMQILKHGTLVFLFLNAVLGLWIFMDLDSKNKYLSQYGVKENTATRYEQLKKEKKNIEKSIQNKEDRIEEIERQIENKEYSSYTTLIRSLRKEQLVYFNTSDQITDVIEQIRESDEPIESILKDFNIDATQSEIETLKEFQLETNTDTEMLHTLLKELGVSEKKYGILEAPFHVREYLTSPEFTDIILSPDNKIIVKDVTINRNFMTFQIEGSNTLFGTTFYLYTKFIETLNAFPFLKDGKLTLFEKEKDEYENYVMNSSLKFEIVRNQATNEFDEDEEDLEALEENKVTTKSENIFLDFQSWDNEHQEKDETKEKIRIFSQ